MPSLCKQDGAVYIYSCAHASAFVSKDENLLTEKKKNKTCCEYRLGLISERVNTSVADVDE